MSRYPGTKDLKRRYRLAPSVGGRPIETTSRIAQQRNSKAGIPCLIYVEDGMASMPWRAAAMMAQDE
jgi:hypothetical protein